jgi:hypothetical protein
MDHHWAGIASPLTGAPGYNEHYDDLGAQISLDVIGWVAPGLANAAAELADPAAHLINWGNGADGGLFIAALSGEAFFISDCEQLINRAAAVLPEGSRYGKMVADTLRVSRQQRDWRMARQMLAAIYSPKGDPGDITAVTNGIPILLGLLYGRGDFGESMLIALKCRWDSDCSAASVGGVLGVLLGASHLPPSWSLFLNDTYENQCLRGLPRWMTFTKIAQETIEIGSVIVDEQGGHVSGDGEQRVFSIPAQEPRHIARKEEVTPGLLEQNKQAMLQHYRERLKGVAESWDPHWTLTMSSFETRPEVLPNYFGRANVLRVQPGVHDAVLERTVALEAGKHHYLRLGVAHQPRTLCDATGQFEFGNWHLEVLVDSQHIGEYFVNSYDGRVLWEDPQFDLTPYAGRVIRLSLVTHKGRFMFLETDSTSYWSQAEILSLDQPEPWRNNFRP